MALPQDIPYLRDTTGNIYGFQYGSTMQYVGTEGEHVQQYDGSLLDRCYLFRGNSYTPYASQCEPAVPNGVPKTQLNQIYREHNNGNPGYMLAYIRSNNYTMASNWYTGIVSGIVRNLVEGTSYDAPISGPPSANIIVGNLDLSHYCIVPYIGARDSTGSAVTVNWGTYKERYINTHPYIISVAAYVFYKSDLSSSSRAQDVSNSVGFVGSVVRNDEVPITIITGGASAYVRDVLSFGRRQICFGNVLYRPVDVPRYDSIFIPSSVSWADSYIGVGGVTSTHSPAIQKAHLNSNGRIDWIYIDSSTAESIIKSMGMWVCDTEADTASMFGIYTISDHVWAPEIGSDGIPTGDGWTGGGVSDPTESPIFQNWDAQNEQYPIGGSDALGAVTIDIHVPVPKESDNKELDEDTEELLPETPTLNGLGLFSNYFAMNANDVFALSDFLWNAEQSVIDDVINSLMLFGANPINAILSLRLYPFDVSAFVEGGEHEQIYLGRVNARASGIKLQNNSDAVLDLGSLYIQSHFNDFRDYAPYSAYNLYVPFIGTVSLNPNDYLNRLIRIKMIVDITTGKATAIIYANGIPMQYLDGMIGVEIPITSENMGQTASAIISAVGNTAGALTTGNMLSAAMTAAAGAADVLFNDVSINKIGNVSAAAALYAPINAYVVISRPNIVLPGNYGHSRGYACDMSAELDNLTGFTVCVNVDTSSIAGATDNERAEIKNLLEGGIYL